MGSHYVTAYATIQKLTQQFRNLRNKHSGRDFFSPFLHPLKNFCYLCIRQGGLPLIGRLKGNRVRITDSPAAVCGRVNIYDE